MRKLLIPAACLLGLLLTGLNYNPGEYPLLSPKNPTLSNGAVIYAHRALLSACEVANTSASAQWYYIFDSTTVPANTSTPTNVIGFIYCSATSTCSWTAQYPPVPSSGSGAPLNNGLSWANSSTFNALTKGSADSFMECAYTPYG